MKVDFPDPLPPSSIRISPDSKVMETLESTRFPEKVLETEVTASAGTTPFVEVVPAAMPSELGVSPVATGDGNPRYSPQACRQG